MALALACGGCRRGEVATFEVSRPADDVIAAVTSLGRDVDGLAMSALPPVHLRVEQPSANMVRIVMPGDGGADIPFDFTVTPGADAQHSTLRFETHMPATIGVAAGDHRPIDGPRMGEQLRYEAERMVEALNDGSDPDTAAGSMRMALHAVGIENRSETREQMRYNEKHIDEISRDAGIKAANDYIDTQTQLTPEQRDRIRATVDKALQERGERPLAP